jgi:L-amino acid N-acyltransferase YncA
MMTATQVRCFILRMGVRRARVTDAADIARIHNEGIADRVATFETRLRSVAEVAAKLGADPRHPTVVVEREGQVIAWAGTSEYRAREVYRGVAEFSVYVARSARGQGAGRLAMEALIQAAEDSGLWKLVSRVFPENAASRSLLRQVGFREVGTYRHHAKLDGQWRDVVIVERLLGPARD